MERTVAEVLPPVQQNRAQIEQIVKMLRSRFDAANKEIDEFKKIHGVTSRGRPMPQLEEEDQKSTGVLV